jgi:hypothetical protein
MDLPFEDMGSTHPRPTCARGKLSKNAFRAKPSIENTLRRSMVLTTVMRGAGTLRRDKPKRIGKSGDATLSELKDLAAISTFRLYAYQA